MIEFLEISLPLLVYALLVVLIILLIIISIKVIKAMNKVNVIVEDVDDKVKSLNGFFHVIDAATDKISVFSDVITDGIVALIKKLITKRKKDEIKEEKEDEEE
ncbi:MAG TPA: hypothetical protein PKY25_01740 [Bacilli bacterium]|nr:hypothetical protein [Bacilli bacterium]